MGVKSLWSLLGPAGRPVMLETVEGKSMAIDSSIWIYQFQATMRDKEGRGLVNAHVLGFLRRICKLLFYGIQPVFVFDGGAPALKRMTISERKNKKSGAAESHEKIAQKLLAAQMRKEALMHAKSSSSISKGVNKPPEGPVSVDDDTVYLEDLDGSNPPRTPARNKGKAKETPSSSPKKSRWHDHDPYRLPEIDMDAAVTKATRSSAPDPRLATEDELRTFIEMIRPEDLDVNSPAFLELPTEVQYEIIGDLRLRSRQTSHKRLQAMLRQSRTPLDFSRYQIQNLKQRNALTQQLLGTTDSVGKANVVIPIRIAAERNKEYMLVKNEDEIGGWVLGIRDDGTEEKPIVLDNADEHFNSDEESDDDMDMEEVPIPQTAQQDPDLREYRRELTLSGVEKRQASAAARGRPTVSAKKKSPRKEPLFIPDADDGELDDGYEIDGDWEDAEDSQMLTAMQASLEDLEADDLRRAIEVSRKTSSNGPPPGISGSRRQNEQDEDSDDDLYADFTPSRLDAALRFANTSRDTQMSPPVVFPKPLMHKPSPRSEKQVSPPVEDEDEDEDMEEVPVPIPLPSAISSTSKPATQSNVFPSTPKTVSKGEIEGDVLSLPSTPVRRSKEPNLRPLGSNVLSDEAGRASSKSELNSRSERDASMNAPPMFLSEDLKSPRPSSTKSSVADSALILNRSDERVPTSSLNPVEGSKVTSPKSENELHLATSPPTTDQGNITSSNVPQIATAAQQFIEQSDSEFSRDDSWSRPGTPGGSTQQPGSTAPQEEAWDAAEEMNVHEETGEFVRFAAQVRGRDLDSVRAEIDDEIRQLRQQRKVAMRDSEDVTQAMIAQIMTMLRLFGIPYITAPMEAEAQCAALVELGLVDGVITDDSDVFLFGAKRVFKNMFNQAKTVECFLLTDLARELGLDRGTLVRLAYLLGSDYVTGLPGVGPVVAMELLREFPGDDGLHKFKDWWTRVQSGRDKESDNTSSFRKRFKKRFKDLYLPSDWPNPAVRDAYYYAVVDASEEPFKWGLPDLDGLRSFFYEELGWNAGKVDELLLPIIQKMNKRGQDAASNRQGTLNTFFSVSEGAGAAEPRRRQAYASRRLQALVSEHRKAQKQRAEDAQPEGSEEEEAQPVTKKRKKTTSEGDEKSKRNGKGESSKRGTNRTRRGRGGRTAGESRVGKSDATETEKGKTKSRTKGKSTKRTKLDDLSDASDDFVPEGAASAAPVREMELRKRVRPRPAYRVAKPPAVNEDRTVGGVEREGEDVNANIDGVDSETEGSEYQG